MPTDAYRHKELWSRRHNAFTIEVSRHTVSGGAAPHRWCVYAYIYPEHPRFGQIVPTGTMWQDPLTALPVNWCPSFFETHYRTDGSITSFQVGFDYNHDRDDTMNRAATPQEAARVFRDADALYDFLAAEKESAHD